MTILHNLVFNRNFQNVILHAEKITHVAIKGSPLALCDISTSIINSSISSSHILWIQFEKHRPKCVIAEATVYIFL